MHWALAFSGEPDRGKPVALDQKTHDDFIKLGVPAHALPEIIEEEEHFLPVPPDIWDSLGHFLALQTQWRLAVGLGGAVYLGFDYAGVAGLLKVMKVKKANRVMKDIQVMEQAALPILNGNAPSPEDRIWPIVEPEGDA